jgi:hypothetical protein
LNHEEAIAMILYLSCVLAIRRIFFEVVYPAGDVARCGAAGEEDRGFHLNFFVDDGVE